MKSKKHTKNKKSATRSKINKKKARKSNRSLGFNDNVSVKNLHDINEGLRLQKTQQSECSWKLVPKDSCEVYRARRRRQKRSRDSSEESSSQRDKRAKKKPKKNGRKTRRKRKAQSVSSLESRPSCSSMSIASYTSTSGSDMEY